MFLKTAEMLNCFPSVSSDGPSNTVLKTQPTQSNQAYSTGSNINLTCSAESSPPAMIMWMVNNVYLNNSGPQLQLQNVTVNNSGIYKCISYNPVTLRFSSANVTIWIVGKVKFVVPYRVGYCHYVVYCLFIYFK